MRPRTPTCPRRFPESYNGATLQQPRMRRLFAAAVEVGGDIARMLDVLAVDGRVLDHRLYRLRGLGAARVMTLYDPTRGGRGFESLNLLRLNGYDASTLDRLEQHLLADNAVATVSRLSGDYDYRVSAYHPHRLDAAIWARRLADRSEIAAIQQSQIRRVFGHEIDGVPLASQTAPRTDPR